MQKSQTIEDTTVAGIHLYIDIAYKNCAITATKTHKLLIYKSLSCSIVFKNCATTMLQLCYNFMIQQKKQLLLGVRERSFAYTRKVVWANAKGCLG